VAVDSVVSLAAEALEVPAAVRMVSVGVDGCATTAERSGREAAEGQAQEAAHRKLQLGFGEVVAPVCGGCACPEAPLAADRVLPPGCVAEAGGHVGAVLVCFLDFTGDERVEVLAAPGAVSCGEQILVLDVLVHGDEGGVGDKFLACQSGSWRGCVHVVTPGPSTRLRGRLAQCR